MRRTMDAKVDQVLRAYEARSAAESQPLAELQAQDSRRDIDDLLLAVGPATGQFINLLAKESEARAILEIGTSYGYSTVWLAEAARETGGKVVSLELHQRKVDYAQEQLTEAGLSSYVEFRVGDALATLESLRGPFELVLLDLWKDLYVPSFDLIHPKLAPGGFIVADNMLHPERARPDANRYRARVRAAPDMTTVLLPIGSGIEVSRFR